VWSSSPGKSTIFVFILVFSKNNANKAIKPRSDEMEGTDGISPFLLLFNAFRDEQSSMKSVAESSRVAKQYIKERDELVDRLFTLGEKFQQRRKTIHIAVDLMDRFFLSESASLNKDIQSM